MRLVKYMKYPAFAVLALLPMLSSAHLLTAVKDKHLAQVLTYMDVLADSTNNGEIYPVRIVDVQTELGECWKTIKSCPDVELYIAVPPEALYMEPRVYRLPDAKGWKFDGWLQRKKTGNEDRLVGFKLETTIPGTNISQKERKTWKPTIYDIWIGEDSAEYTVEKP